MTSPSLDRITRLLNERIAEIHAFGAVTLAVFGSVARAHPGPGSDIDLLVEFRSPPSFDEYMGLKLFLEDILGSRVDLVTRRGLRPRLRDRIEAEAVRVA
jgi:uncharacterized protein